MAKRVQKGERPDVEVEVVGVVKHDGEYAEPGSRIVVTSDQAERLVASGHVKRLRGAKGKATNDLDGDGMNPDTEGTDAG